MLHIHINYLAVLAATVAAFALGGLWYSPLLFAKMWVSAHGYSESKSKRCKRARGRRTVFRWFVSG